MTNPLRLFTYSIASPIETVREVKHELRPHSLHNIFDRSGKPLRIGKKRKRSVEASELT